MFEDGFAEFEAGYVAGGDDEDEATDYHGGDGKRADEQEHPIGDSVAEVDEARGGFFILLGDSQLFFGVSVETEKF